MTLLKLLAIMGTMTYYQNKIPQSWDFICQNNEVISF